MDTIYFPKIKTKKTTSICSAVEDNHSDFQIMIGESDLLVDILDDERFESEYRIRRGDEDLRVGFLVRPGQDVQHINFKPGDLVIFALEHFEYIIANLGIVSANACIRLDTEELKIRGGNKPVILKWEK